jgi:hypothetical protein
MPRRGRVESAKIGTHTFHFETPFHCGTDKGHAPHDSRSGFSVNPAFRLETGARDCRMRVLNDFIEFASGTSSAPASDRLEQDHARTTTPRRKRMKT